MRFVSRPARSNRWREDDGASRGRPDTSCAGTGSASLDFNVSAAAARAPRGWTARRSVRTIDRMASRSMRIVFIGTGEIGVPTLQALLGSEHEVAAVVTQPDKP